MDECNKSKKEKKIRGTESEITQNLIKEEIKKEKKRTEKDGTKLIDR